MADQYVELKLRGPLWLHVLAALAEACHVPFIGGLIFRACLHVEVVRG